MPPTPSTISWVLDSSRCSSWAWAHSCCPASPTGGCAAPPWCGPRWCSAMPPRCCAWGHSSCRRTYPLPWRTGYSRRRASWVWPPLWRLASISAGPARSSHGARFPADTWMSYPSTPTLANPDNGPLSSGVARQQHLLLATDGRLQLVERVGERAHAVLQELIRHLLHADAGGVEPGDGPGRVVEVAVDGARDLPVILEGVDRGLRQRGDGIRPDQLFHVFHVAVGRILGARTGPQRALHARPPRPHGGETLPGEHREEALIGQARVGDRRPAAHRGQLPAPRLVPLGRDECVKAPVDLRIDAAHEEAGHRGDAVQRPAGRRQGLQAGEVSLHHPLVRLDGEDQRDVDVEALADELPDGRDARIRRRHLHHDVRAVDRGPEAAGFGDAGRGVVGQPWRYLDADESVLPAGPVIEGAEEVCRGHDVFEQQPFVDRGWARATLQQLLDGRVVVGAVEDRLLEDGRVHRHAPDAAIDQGLQVSGGEEAAPDAVVPGALPQPTEVL